MPNFINPSLYLVNILGIDVTCAVKSDKYLVDVCSDAFHQAVTLRYVGGVVSEINPRPNAVTDILRFVFIGMTMGDFIDKVYCGDELEFIIGETTYFVQGYQEDNKFVLTVDYWNKADGTESNHDYLLSIKCDTLEERLSRFEEATIFNGKTIYEVEKDITVLYG